MIIFGKAKALNPIWKQLYEKAKKDGNVVD